MLKIFKFQVNDIRYIFYIEISKEIPHFSVPDVGLLFHKYRQHMGRENQGRFILVNLIDES